MRQSNGTETPKYLLGYQSGFQHCVLYNDNALLCFRGSGEWFVVRSVYDENGKYLKGTTIYEGLQVTDALRIFKEQA
jgi:hypothetical protein